MFNKKLKKFTCGLLLAGTLLFSGFSIPASAQSQPPEEPESGEPAAADEFDLHAHSHTHEFTLFLPAVVSHSTVSVDVVALGIPEEDEISALAGRTITYPSGQRFTEVTNSVDGISYHDPASYGDVPLVDLNGRTGNKLSANFIAGEFQTNDGARYARISDTLVRNLQKMRTNTGRSITVNSGYRHPTYNSRIGGAATSQHMAGKAADIKVSGLTALQMAEEAIKAFGCSNLGLGLGAAYIHVDVRPGRSTWTYSGAALSSLQFSSWVTDKCNSQSQPEPQPEPTRCLTSPTARTAPPTPNVAHYIGQFKTSNRCTDINVRFSTDKWVYVIASNGRHSGWQKAPAGRWMTPLKNLPDDITWQMWTYDFNWQSTVALIDS